VSNCKQSCHIIFNRPTSNFTVWRGAEAPGARKKGLYFPSWGVIQQAYQWSNFLGILALFLGSWFNSLGVIQASVVTVAVRAYQLRKRVSRPKFFSSVCALVNCMWCSPVCFLLAWTTKCYCLASFVPPFICKMSKREPMMLSGRNLVPEWLVTIRFQKQCAPTLMLSVPVCVSVRYVSKVFISCPMKLLLFCLCFWESVGHECCAHAGVPVQRTSVFL
jgi:hypothetical protein